MASLGVDAVAQGRVWPRGNGGGGVTQKSQAAGPEGGPAARQEQIRSSLQVTSGSGQRAGADEQRRKQAAGLVVQWVECGCGWSMDPGVGELEGSQP